MTAKVETRGSGFFVVSEVMDGHRSREQIIVGQVEPDSETGKAIVEVGTVLGKVALAGTAVASAVTGTGTGAITVDVTNPVGPQAKAGVYKFMLTGVKANSGAFSVTDPDGIALEPAIVGVTYDTPHLKLAIADATDFVVGDHFTVTVAAAADDDQVYLPLSLTARDGTQHVAGILWNQVDVTAEDKDAVAVTADAEVLGGELIYPAAATDDDEAAINLSLKALGILVRSYN